MKRNYSDKQDSTPVKDVKTTPRISTRHSTVSCYDTKVKSFKSASMSYKPTQKDAVKPQAGDARLSVPTKKPSLQKIANSKPKTSSKNEEQPSMTAEQLSLSFILDQNASVDSTNLPASIVNRNAAKELDSGFTRQSAYTSTQLAGNSSKLNSSGITYRKSSSTIIPGRHSMDTSKQKGKVPIVTSPVTVKKKQLSDVK